MDGSGGDTQKATKSSGPFRKKRRFSKISDEAKAIAVLILFMLWCGSLFLLAGVEGDFESRRAKEASQTEVSQDSASNEKAQVAINACLSAFKDFHSTSININKQDVLGMLKIVDSSPSRGDIIADFTYIFPHGAVDTSFILDHGNGWVASYKLQNKYESFLIPHHVFWPTCGINLWLRRVSAVESSD
jgi:hypothetical protein